MTWIRTISFPDADETLRKAIEGQRALYPAEYATPGFPGQLPGQGIVDAHSLLPERCFTRSRRLARSWRRTCHWSGGSTK